jgi:N-acyl-D-amino-acid deacylase
MRKIVQLGIVIAASVLSAVAQGSPSLEFDVIIKGGTVYNGSGGTAVRADVGIKGDRIAQIGDLSRAQAALVIDAK